MRLSPLSIVLFGNHGVATPITRLHVSIDRAYSTPMGNGLGRKAQATIDQLSFWDSVYEASNDSVSSPVDPPAGAQSDGAVVAGER